MTIDIEVLRLLWLFAMLFIVRSVVDLVDKQIGRWASSVFVWSLLGALICTELELLGRAVIHLIRIVRG